MVDLSQQSPSTPASSNEEQARTHLTELKVLFEQRADAVHRGDMSAIHSIEVDIVSKMRQIGDTYPDTESKSEWYEKAEVFERGTDKDKENILMPLAQGLGILIAAPFAVAGGAIFAAGGILYGAEMNNQAPPPPYDNRGRLQELFQRRADAVAQGNHAEVAAIDAQIVDAIRGLGDAEPTTEERRRWHNLADSFQAGDNQEKEHILMPIAKGLGIIIATPFVLAGGVIVAAGSILYGAGKVVQGLGNVLTGGMFR
ncbi:hypothetical protein FRC06_008449 [Ceratobasidium sp. 370]|nr:hypothetical protein FRC06_008449 [Ceratobasidium sp. 370]